MWVWTWVSGGLYGLGTVFLDSHRQVSYLVGVDIVSNHPENGVVRDGSWIREVEDPRHTLAGQLEGFR